MHLETEVYDKDEVNGSRFTGNVILKALHSIEFRVVLDEENCVITCETDR